MTLLVPRYSAQEQIPFDRIAGALFEHDQFDDWLPDVVYYNDQLNEVSSVVARVKSLWRSDSFPSPNVEVLLLPRANGATVPALALPLDARLCAHAVISAFAPRVAMKLLRDKVYGFRFLRDGARIFDPPGEELERVFDNVASAARASSTGAFELVDIVAFNASAKPDRLVATLQGCGARPDECNFLRELAALGGRGLPSIDDAFSFAYNFYLQPIDETMKQRQHNFFRYRDEYFVFDERAKQTVESQLATRGLQGHVVGRSVDIGATIDKMKEEVVLSAPPNHEVHETLVTLPQGTLVASVSCDSINEEDCSDYNEVVFLRRADIDDLFRVRANTPLDAVTILPHLRDLNAKRATGVVLGPPFIGETESQAKYRTALNRGREWLGSVLTTGIRTGSSWQAGWAATLLSDVGMLSETEAGLVLRLLAAHSIGETAKVQARLALARSSTLTADRFWTRELPKTEYRRRGMLLAARHLARRNPAPWKALQQAVGAHEPQLIRHLTANIQVKQ